MSSEGAVSGDAVAAAEGDFSGEVSITVVLAIGGHFLGDERLKNRFLEKKANICLDA